MITALVGPIHGLIQLHYEFSSNIKSLIVFSADLMNKSEQIIYDTSLDTHEDIATTTLRCLLHLVVKLDRIT